MVVEWMGLCVLQNDAVTPAMDMVQSYPRSVSVPENNPEGAIQPPEAFFVLHGFHTRLILISPVTGTIGNGISGLYCPPLPMTKETAVD
jgi:hypothetical protein